MVLAETGQELLKGAPTMQQDLFVRQFQALEGWEQSMVTAALERIACILDVQHLDAAPVLDIGKLDRTLESD